jgi:hypothetical protein
MIQIGVPINLPFIVVPSFLRGAENCFPQPAKLPVKAAKAIETFSEFFSSLRVEFDPFSSRSTIFIESHSLLSSRFIFLIEFFPAPSFGIYPPTQHNELFSIGYNFSPVTSASLSCHKESPFQRNNSLNLLV